ncbi:MAG: hypothetical protein IJI34_06975 [Clostridia bacterium]|nr:hypothetical protein [Clostridia bacterium]
MRRRNIFNLCIQISVLTVLVFLYGLSLYAEMPRYWETIAVSALLLTLFGAGCVRLVPALSSTAMGEEEEHLRREGDRTFRRCGTRELFKLFLLVLIVRLLEFPLTYIVHFRLFGYSGTFFEIQRLWLDFYHAETAFPLYGYLSDVFWLVSFNFNHARFIGSYFFTALAVVSLYYLVQLDFDRRIARRSVRYFLLMPFSLVLMATVPDGLFLLFSILCLLFIRKKLFPLANLFAMLAVLTHALGLLLFFPIVLAYISYLIGNIRSNREMGKGYILKQVGNTISFLLIPLGVGLVLLYAKLMFGDPAALYRAALGASGVGLSDLFRFTDAAFDQTLIVGGHSAAILCGTYLTEFLYLLFGAVMLLLACGTIPTSYAFLMAVTLPMIVALGRTADSARIITMTAPFVITLAVRIKHRWVDTIVTLLLAAGWVAYFFAFIAGHTGGIG